MLFNVADEGEGAGEIVCALCAQPCPTLWDPVVCSPPGSSVHGFSRQEYWSGLLFPAPGDLRHPGMEPSPLASTALATGLLITSTTWEALGKSSGVILKRDLKSKFICL